MSGVGADVGLRAIVNGAALTDYSVTSEIENMIPLPANSARISVRVTAPACYVGDYEVQTNRLDDKPLGVRAPEIAYDAVTGTLTLVEPGLWAYDETIAPPQIRYSWRRDNRNIRGAVGTTYALQPEDYGHTLELIERATDANGATAQRSLAITAAAPAPFEVIVEADGTLRIDGNDGRSFEVDPASAAFAGIYSVPQSTLASGPVTLVPPMIEVPASVEPGQVLSITPALFAYDPDLGDPLITYSTGVDASDPARPLYTISADDQGSMIAITATALQSVLSTQAESNAVVIPAPPPPPDLFEVIVQVDGTLRIDGNDGRTFEVDVASAAHAGNYSVPPSALAAGPVVLVPPVLEVPTSVAPGQVLAITPALFAYDPDLGDPVITYSAGVDARDPGEPVYVVRQDDLGTTLSIAVTASQGALDIASSSNAVAVP